MARLWVSGLWVKLKLLFCVGGIPLISECYVFSPLSRKACAHFDRQLDLRNFAPHRHTKKPFFAKHLFLRKIPSGQGASTKRPHSHRTPQVDFDVVCQLCEHFHWLSCVT